MPDVGGCEESIQILNLVFGTWYVFNDGHEVLAQLEQGAAPVEVVDGLAAKFGSERERDVIRTVVQAWPPLHLEAVSRMLQWALSKLDSDDRITITWRGNDHNEDTVTRFELRGNTLLIEFAHPPARIGQAARS